MDITQDIIQFNKFITEYTAMGDDDVVTANKLMQMSYAFAARWNNITLNATKIEVMSDMEIRKAVDTKSKTAVSKWCDHNYQLLKEAYIHCRQIANRAKENYKYQPNE